MSVEDFTRGARGNVECLYDVLLMVENLLCASDWCVFDGIFVYESIQNVWANFDKKRHMQYFPNFSRWNRKEKKKMKDWFPLLGSLLRQHDDFLLPDKYSIVLQSILFQLNVTDVQLDFVCFFIFYHCFHCFFLQSDSIPDLDSLRVDESLFDGVTTEEDSDSVVPTSKHAMVLRARLPEFDTNSIESKDENVGNDAEVIDFADPDVEEGLFSVQEILSRICNF